MTKSATSRRRVPTHASTPNPSKMALCQGVNANTRTGAPAGPASGWVAAETNPAIPRTINNNAFGQ